MKHTPGPWKVGEVRHDYDCVIRNADNDPVAITNVAGYATAIAKANARLVAAAPDLLAALEDAYVILKSRSAALGLDDQGPVMDKVRVAIAKAGAA